MDNIQYSHKSMIDDFGRVFFYNNRVFREISKEKEKFCLELLSSAMFKELIQKELIPQTLISEEFPETKKLILEHTKVVESLQHEWTFEMFKDAALMVLEINDVCNKYGYELKDAHTLNVLFNNNKPIFVDLGSIDLIRSKNNWIAYEEFLNSFFIPLRFWSKNELFIVRKLLESNFHRMFTIPSQNIEESGLYKLLGVDNSYAFSFRKNKLFSTERNISLITFFVKASNKFLRIVFKKKNKLFRYDLKINRITEIFPKNTINSNIVSLSKSTFDSQWKGYHSKFYNEIESVNYSYRFKRLLEIINDLKDIDTIIDLAGNEGYFSFLLSKEMTLKNVILVDYDENAINEAYLNSKKLNIKNVTPLLLNFMFTPDLLGTSKRLRSDLAVSLAVTHHLILTGKFSLAAIFDRLIMFSNKYVIVEFMPLGLWSIETKIKQNLPDWYSIDWFRDEFVNRFNLLIEEQLEENRIVFVGKIK
ncbi:class I SAM-dependent methyltransferase [Flavobacterium sp. N3904]|uniref:class I SAM-dependent methyltransferase n=1 Tax=Flavobacterium sp. N3904 TaxID=2986835 RepID=UPI0022245625|nr:class I SAM-dependent methyltransferase [Flavobacterium sp. N3904]